MFYFDETLRVEAWVDSWVVLWRRCWHWWEHMWQLLEAMLWSLTSCQSVFCYTTLTRTRQVRLFDFLRFMNAILLVTFVRFIFSVMISESICDQLNYLVMQGWSSIPHHSKPGKLLRYTTPETTTVISHPREPWHCDPQILHPMKGQPLGILLLNLARASM